MATIVQSMNLLERNRYSWEADTINYFFHVVDEPAQFGSLSLRENEKPLVCCVMMHAFEGERILFTDADGHYNMALKFAHKNAGNEFFFLFYNTNLWLFIDFAEVVYILTKFNL